MHITYLTLEAPREGQASYVHVHEIIAGLRAQGCEVQLYQPSYTQKAQSPGLLLRLFHSLWFQGQLWLSWHKGSTLYVRAHYLAFPSALVAKIFGVSIIHELNGPYEDVFVTHPALNKVRGLLIPIQRWQYRKASGVIAVTRDLQKWANTEGRRNDCAFISNGANTTLFAPDIVRPQDMPERYVVFFGGLTRWHGVPVMIEAAALPDWPSNVKLVVIGQGQESERLQQAVKKNNNIVVLGHMPYKSIPAYVANAIAGLVMISDPDNRSSTGVFPLKLFETLSAGVPVIVSDLPGQADFVREHNCGIVVPVDDAAVLARAVAHCAEKPSEARKMGTAGRAAVLAEHSWESRSRDTLSYILSGPMTGPSAQRSQNHHSET